MLAFELYLKNKDFTGEFPKSVKPVKKVIMRGSNPVLDRKALEQYGGAVLEDYESFQSLFSMPANSASGLGLRFRATSPNSPKPYVELFGQFLNNRSGPTMSLTIGKDAALFSAKLDLKTKKISIVAKGSILLNMDKERYLISGKNLYDEYVRSKVLTRDGRFQPALFIKICKVFFKHVLSHWKDDEIKNDKISFSLVILPKDADVVYRSTNEEGGSEAKEFVDSFGNKARRYASETTITAKFLSYDDPAFPINCTDSEQFYRNLSVGEESHRLVNINAAEVFRISGLQWMFTNIAKPEYSFTNTRRGIYYQLWKNYNELSRKTGRLEGMSQLKVLCYLTSQAKMEVMIDENLTMRDMEEMFAGHKEGEIPPSALEVLIETKGKTTVWTHYLAAVRSLLARKSMDRNYLLSRFVLQLRNDLPGWLSKKAQGDAALFFQKSDFCIKVLCKGDNLNGGAVDGMNGDEQYAYHVGVIAAEYIKFKESSRESNNSLKDILAYSRYDREKLRFVMQRIGLGLSLSKAPEDGIKKMESFIRDHQPAAEISDGAAYNDYSYFFYKGYFAANARGKRSETV